VSPTVDAMLSQHSIYLFNVCVLMKFDLKLIFFSLFSPKVSNFDFKILIFVACLLNISPLVSLILPVIS
jgi:hypothetical protein